MARVGARTPHWGAASPLGSTIKRHFQKNTYLKGKQQQQQQKGSVDGRDPYGLFKEALSSQPPDDAPPQQEDAEARQARRAAYSRAKMLERHRIDAHFTKMLKLREAAIAALPEELQAEARKPDYTLVPVQRPVFTETAPIPRFQERLENPNDEADD
jgi:hypothetical protein